MTASTEHPRVFISYSWTNAEHEKFVLDLATALRNHGVDAILDKWDLKPGQDKYVFMESMVTDSTVSSVLVVCDSKYRDKANSRAGGVGTESQIISQELYGKVKQTKFIPVVCEYDEDDQPYLPVFMKGLIYVDMSSDERYGEGLDELLRLIFEQPLYQKPRLGARPVFADDVGQPFAKELSAVIRAVRDAKPARQGLETLFIKSLLTEVTRLYAEPTGQDYHEGVYKEIVNTRFLRDQVADYCEAVAAFSGDEPSSINGFVRILEGIGAHFGPPERSGSYYPGWKDLYSYFALEVFLIQVAALIRHVRWSSLRRLLSTTYIVRGDHGELKAESYPVFNRSLVSLDEHRNHALNLRRTSLSADLLKERCSPEKTSFAELMEADVLLGLISLARLGSASDSSWRRRWIPRTTVYYGYGTKLPLFLRAADEFTRQGIYLVAGVQDGPQLKAKLDEAEKILGGFGNMGFGRFNEFDLAEAANLKELVR